MQQWQRRVFHRSLGLQFIHKYMEMDDRRGVEWGGGAPAALVWKPQKKKLPQLVPITGSQKGGQKTCVGCNCSNWNSFNPTEPASLRTGALKKHLAWHSSQLWGCCSVSCLTSGFTSCHWGWSISHGDRFGWLVGGRFFEIQCREKKTEPI